MTEISTQTDKYIKLGTIAWKDADPLDRTLVMHRAISQLDPCGFSAGEVEYKIEYIVYTDDGTIDYDKMTIIPYHDFQDSGFPVPFVKK